MSINVFHTISALKSTIIVHVNNLSYTQDGVVNIELEHIVTYNHILFIQFNGRKHSGRKYLTIDMFKFTDVTASHVYSSAANNVQSYYICQT